MPNHITTLCTVKGDEDAVAAFQARHIERRDDGPVLDFNSVVPMPQCVKDTMRGYHPGELMIGDAVVEVYARALLENRCLYIGGSARPIHVPSSVERWGDLIAWLDAQYPTIAKWSKARLLCAAETGYPGWYEWSCAMWGTKWNAYCYGERVREPGRLVFHFETAWAVPVPIFEALAAQWPSLSFEAESIDEGGGEYVGQWLGVDRAFARVPDDAERYRRVYGRDPRSDDD